MAHYDAPVRNTRQRKYLLRLLMSTDAHPNAQWLFERMKAEFPRLSFSTVYRNLDILEKEGKLQRLTCGNAEGRYDGNAAPHAHFFCRRCGEVYDVDFGPIEQSVMQRVKRCSHNVEGCRVTYYGICKNCLKAKNKNNHIKE